MRLFIYAIRDRATDQFGNPMFLVASGQAIRSFTDQVNRKEENNPLFDHPDDFDLFALGSFETNTGVFDTGAPEQICIGKNVKVR